MQIKSFLLQMERVWHLLKKPSSLEFKTISKVSAIGLLIIGLVGFMVSLFMGFFK